MDAELNEVSPGVSRRSLLRRGLTAIGVASIAPMLSACDVPFLSSGGDPFEMPVETPEEAITRLLEGNARFVRGKSTTINESADRRVKLAERQRPFATIFSCVDSRVPPELVFDRGLGDLFVIRTAGNVVDSAVMGSLEYGAYELEIPLLLVLGHKKCGAVKATMETIASGGKAEGSIAYLVEAIRPAVEKETTEELAMASGEHDGPHVSKLLTESGAEPAVEPDVATGGSVDPLTGETTDAVTVIESSGQGATVPDEPPGDETTPSAASEKSETTVAETEAAPAEETVPVDESIAEEEGEEGAEADPLTIAIKRNVALTVARVMKSPMIAERIHKDRLRVVGAIYDLETGIVELTDNVPKQFLPEAAEDPEA